LPLLRLTRTYQALVSTVAADAGAAVATAIAPPASAVATAANPASHGRRRRYRDVGGTAPVSFMALLIAFEPPRGGYTALPAFVRDATHRPQHSGLEVNLCVGAK
jgi:hypothetical protein